MFRALLSTISCRVMIWETLLLPDSYRAPRHARARSGEERERE